MMTPTTSFQATRCGTRWYLIKKTSLAPNQTINGSTVTPVFGNEHDLFKKTENDGLLESITELNEDGQQYDRSDLVKTIKQRPKKINGEFGD